MNMDKAVYAYVASDMNMNTTADAARAACCLLACVLAGVVGSLISCSRTVPLNSVLLVVLDTARADRLGCYGYDGAGTPCIDRLAQQGIVFDQAYTSVPITLPAHASIFTGTYPVFHGVRDNSTFQLAESLTTLAEVLVDHGFSTGGFIGGLPVHSQFGLAQGFETYDERLHTTRSEIASRTQVERPGEQVVRSAVAWLEDLREDEPFFAFVHLFDPHVPYQAPARFAKRYPNDLYQAEIAYTDTCLGELLDFLHQSGRDKSTLVIMVADHGEGLGDHGEDTHTFLIYETTMRVPLIISGPGIASGVRIPDPVRTIDIMPTLLALLNVPAPADVQGRSLADLIAGRTAPSAPVLLETEFPKLRRGWSELSGLVNGRFKLITAPSAREPRNELYDLQNDPGELNDIAAAEPDRVAQMLAELQRVLAGTRGAARDTAHAPSEETLENLRQLGYVGGGSQVPSGGNAAHPAKMMPLLRQLGVVKGMIAQKRYEEAVELLDRLEEEYPGEVGIIFNRGLCYLEWSRQDPRHRQRAIELFKNVLRIHPNHESATKLLGNLTGKRR